MINFYQKTKKNLTLKYEKLPFKWHRLSGIR